MGKHFFTLDQRLRLYSTVLGMACVESFIQSMIETASVEYTAEYSVFLKLSKGLEEYELKSFQNLRLKVTSKG